MDTMAIYLFFFGMLAFVLIGLLVPARYITIPEDDDAIEVK
ncbi:hypothetical protein A8990_13155 [Paenibacillus taihuensis]|uniref:Uncharacterized protein n=1 Tax=Paenibacillus taihuensis TaxID=1156355 RepID=A0A3D9R3T9_9BACL|nr:hypothetical protein [Paenibacillus taihuensis]REE69736.1 hypothetical protein A8990_13155 [Paenibacillus taihuensis]